MIFKRLLCSFSAVFLLSMMSLNCVSRSAKLPSEIVGISIGMNRDAVKQKLSEAAIFDHPVGTRQEVWRMKDDSKFNFVAVGFNGSNEVLYVTAFVNEEKAGKSLRFSDIGDISRAKAEIVEPHHRYIWDVAESPEYPAYQVVVNGKNADFATIYSINKIKASGEAKQGEEEDDDE